MLAAAVNAARRDNRKAACMHGLESLSLLRTGLYPYTHLHVPIFRGKKHLPNVTVIYQKR